MHVRRLRRRLRVFRDPRGCLLATDMFGGTPSNLGITFLEANKVEVVTGVNLPMLIKAASLREQRDLTEVARSLREHGRNAIWVASDLLKGFVASMTSGDVTICNRLGLHARAAARFVHLATRFQSRVQVSRDGRGMDGKSIMGILLLAAPRGATVTIATEGPDEAEALAALTDLVASGFGEETWNA